VNWISSKNIYNRWVIITLLTGGLITCAVAYNIQSSNEKRITQSANDTSNKVMQEVLTRIELYQYGLRGARGAVLTTGENGITRDIFSLYSATRDVDVEFPGARGFGFIRRVTQADAEAFTALASKDDWPDFAIKTFFPNVNEHFVIQYIEPVERNRQAVGLDIASEKNRREAATSSLYTGEVRLTGPITLVQSSGKAQQSVLILMPIYRGGKVPNTLDERIKAGFGWSYAPLLMEEVLDRLDIAVDKVHYELFDVTDLDNKVRFYDSGELKDSHDETIQSRLIYGRNWESHLSVSSAFITDLHLPDPFDFLIIGSFISFLGAILVAMIRVNTDRHREVIAHQSRITAVVESSADGIISKSLEGVIVSWNKGAENIFGYTQDEAIGKSSFELLVPTDLQNEDKTILSSVIDNKQSIIIETRWKTKLGSDVPVALTVSPIFDSNHWVVGVSNSVRDISERKKAEAKIRDLNSSLERQVKERTLELQEINLLLNDVLTASSEIAIIATDMNGKINLFNSGAQRMLGYSAEEVVGQMTPLGFHVKAEIEQERDVIFETTGTYVLDLMEVLIFKAFQNNCDSKEWTYIDKYGQTKRVSLVITPMKNSNDDTIGFLGMATDITKQKVSRHSLV
jgi:PAS domain S-box-containing protein